MFFLSTLFYSASILILTDQAEQFFTGTYTVNTIDCPSDKECTFIDHCLAVWNLMNQNQLPIHRFRQAICGYERAKPKVCCDINNNNANPILTRRDGVFARSNSIPKCGRAIAYGDVNSRKMYPFVAKIGFKSNTGEIVYPCSGAILNERTVLTTASCALAKSTRYKLDSVLVGELDDESISNPDAQRLDISYVIKHPNYQSEIFANNIAMLRLNEPIRYAATVQPVCLIRREWYLNTGTTSVLAGWGKTARQTTKPCKQQALTMKILSTDQCTNYYDQGLSVELCAIGNETPCGGYSGSPLLSKHEDTYFLLGLLSYGSDCSVVRNFPSVFVDVQKYIRWIFENC
ncbi:chymotrypsin-like protease CTRL-1 [Ceratina calcarata]|uniref:Chymotrypsin-like protease CTRL-1 n=1 Tax=Ceratina calcarata TaxID=156304 RepID=A0AAJ7IZH7_9HYME|nr:chymotrypsin-like protease CTRL-1 [Ceratina calcarata]